MSKPLRVWSKFSVTKGNTTLKLRAVEPPVERVEEIVELLFNHFGKEEAIFKAAGVLSDEESAVEYKRGITRILQSGVQHTVVCCLDDDSDEIGEIIAGSFMTLNKRDTVSDLKLEPKTKGLRKMFELVFAIGDMYNLMDEQKIDQYYDGRGLVVHSKYRGYGIAQELFRVRRLVCQELGVPITSALMTAYGTQKAAERDGWKILFEVKFEDIAKVHDVVFEDCPPTAKLMAARVL